MQPDDLTVTDRTTLRRHPERGAHEWAAVEAVLDAAPISHVATVGERGPVVLPMAFGRIGRRLYLHGSPAAGTLRVLAAGAEACVTVTIVDGLVLSRSAFHHSMNYRCAVMFGCLEAVDDPEEKTAAFAAIVEHVVADRWRGTRAPNAQELRATRVLRLDIEEASTKVRQGGPVEEPDDLALPHWAGVLPLGLTPTGSPVPEPDLASGTTTPDAVARWDHAL